MRLLLDTHVFLWFVRGSDALPHKARTRIEQASAVYVSAASIWECAIKVCAGKFDVDIDMLSAAIEQAGFRDLPITRLHARAVADMPLHHRDPFDRLLIAQAQIEPLVLLTADALLARYSSNVELCA